MLIKDQTKNNNPQQELLFKWELQNCKAWNKEEIQTIISKAAIETIQELTPTSATNYKLELSILITDSKIIKFLNNKYRKKNIPTNVLSFPSPDLNFCKKSTEINLPKTLGDIALALDYIKQEAQNTGKIFLDHLIHLTIHGILHLFGYHHDNEKDAALMKKYEKLILNNLNVVIIDI